VAGLDLNLGKICPSPFLVVEVTSAQAGVGVGRAGRVTKPEKSQKADSVHGVKGGCFTAAEKADLHSCDLICWGICVLYLGLSRGFEAGQAACWR